MNERQMQLIDFEISRHISLASIAKNPVIKRDHLEVAEALTAVLSSERERKNIECKQLNLARHIPFIPQKLPVIVPVCARRKKLPPKK